MDKGTTRLRSAGALLGTALVCLVLGACGSSSGGGNATALLRQTFTGAHSVNSGKLEIQLAIAPSASSTIKGPITISFGGPFQSLGTGKLPKSDFNVGLSALGTGGSLGIISTGTSGYVTLAGSSYQLPQADFQKLESSFSQLASSPGAGKGSSLLGKLGIQPLRWLVNPQVLGTETVGGASTTHIRSGINVPVLLSDFNTFLERASSLGVSGAKSFSSGISAATRAQIAGKIQNPTFDVWTGTSDKTIRELEVHLTVPVSGQLSAVLGRSVGIGLSIEYADLNQPQTITAPTTVLPYSQFQTKLRALVQSLTAGLGSALGSGLGGSGLGGSGTTTGSSTTASPGTTTGTAGAGAGAKYQAYSTCIQAANGSVAKMQLCASLLNAK